MTFRSKGLVWVLGIFWATTQNPKGLQLGYFLAQTADFFFRNKREKQTHKQWNKKSGSGKSSEWLGKKEESLQLLLLGSTGLKFLYDYFFLFRTTALVSLHGFYSYFQWLFSYWPEAGLFHPLLSSTPCTLWDGFSGKAGFAQELAKLVLTWGTLVVPSFGLNIMNKKSSS